VCDEFTRQTSEIAAPNSFENLICDPNPFRRILNYDQSGRIFVVLPFRRQPTGARQVSVLSELTVGESAVVIALDLPENVQNHLMHMGFVPDATVTALRRAPAGDPTVYSVDGLEIALRRETAAAIQVRADASAKAAAENGSKSNSRRNGAAKNRAIAAGENSLAEAAR
jgi:ferrous iron transport protein A